MTDTAADRNLQPDPAVARLAREIRRLRKNANLSHAQLAGQIGYSRQYISLAERATKGLPSAELVNALDSNLHAGGALIALRQQALAGRLERRRHARIAAGKRPGRPSVDRSLTEGSRRGEAALTAPNGVLVPLVVDGHDVLLPMVPGTATGRGLAAAMTWASTPADTSHLRARPAALERAYELYLRGQGLLPTNEKASIDAAVTLLDRALDIDPSFARARAARGYALWRQYFAGWRSEASMIDRALGDVDTAIQLDPESIGARTALIRICWDMGWHQRALEIGHEIYAKNPESLDATLAFARALNNAGMAEEARPLTLAALDADATNPTALKLLIWSYLMTGDLRACLEVAGGYLPAYPLDSNTRWAVASAQAWCGEHKAAIETAQSAVSADQDDIAAWNLLGYLHRLYGEEPSAQAAWSAGVERISERKSPPVGQFNVRQESWLANAEACIGRTEQASIRVRRLSDIEPNNGYVKYRLAHAHAELGDSRVAIQFLREAVNSGFLSAQLLRREELFGLSSLVGVDEYIAVRRALEQRVERLRRKYSPRLQS